MSEPYDDLYRAIGRVVYEWAWLEADVAHLVFDLSTIHSRAFYDDPGMLWVSNAYFANLDLKSNIAVAKSLAYFVGGGASFPLFQEVEAILTKIGSDMRNERNRFIHDRWHLADGKAIRYKEGTGIPKQPGTGERVLHFSTEKRFHDIAEVNGFADQIAEVRAELLRLSETAQAIHRAKYKLEE